MRRRELGFFLRGRINNVVARVLNARRPVEPVASLSLPAVLALRDPSPLDLARLLEGRGNAERETLVRRYLAGRAVPFRTHRFASFEGEGENFVVEAGEGDRVLVLIAHHDAVPGSPGANDNAAAVGILLRLLTRVRAAPPASLRVRFMFTAAEERGYLGAREYVKQVDQRGVVGVVSLELCGVGDTLALWDATEETPLVRAFAHAVEGLGYRRDQSYHVVGRIPVFGSDHRAFWEVGVPAYGLTIVPACEADSLREFVFSPWRSAFRQLVRRPPPFDTYHTSGDRSDTLDPVALDRAGAALEALIRAF